MVITTRDFASRQEFYNRMADAMMTNIRNVVVAEIMSARTVQFTYNDNTADLRMRAAPPEERAAVDHAWRQLSYVIEQVLRAIDDPYTR